MTLVLAEQDDITSRRSKLLWISSRSEKHEDEFDFLGRHVTQKKDYTIEIDMDKYLRAVDTVNIPMLRPTTSTISVDTKGVTRLPLVSWSTSMASTTGYATTGIPCQ